MNNSIDKAEIKKSYYYTDIEPQLDALLQIIQICDDFEKDGGDKLAYALSLRHWDLDEIGRLSLYIMQAQHRMEEGLKRIKILEQSFNEEFATNHNLYFNSADELLHKIRSHTSPLKTILKKFCPRNHPNQKQCKFNNIKPKSVRDKSALARGDYQLDLFPEHYPLQVKELLSYLQLFFAAEKECMKICTAILEEEDEIRKDPIRSKYILDKYRQKTFDKLKNEVRLFTDDVIDTIIELCPAYKKRMGYVSDEVFAQEEFHKHNVADMDDFCRIEMALAKRNNNLDADAVAMCGNNPETCHNIDLIIENFDALLPDDFSQKQMGEYLYYFCKYVHPENIKQGVDYFTKRYKGKYHVVKYRAVNAHKDSYSENSIAVRNFRDRINKLSNPQEENLKIYAQ